MEGDLARLAQLPSATRPVSAAAPARRAGSAASRPPRRRAAARSSGGSSPASGRGVGQRQHHPGQRDPVGDAVVHAADHRPRRPRTRRPGTTCHSGRLRSSGIVIRSPTSSCSAARVAGRRQRQVVHVVLEREVGIVLPPGRAQRERGSRRRAGETAGSGRPGAAGVDLLDAVPSRPARRTAAPS